jgi:hypothetical protein
MFKFIDLIILIGKRVNLKPLYSDKSKYSQKWDAKHEN